jgi:acylglycerol lipase
MTEWYAKYEGYIPSVGIYYPEENWIDFNSIRGTRLTSYRFQHPNPKALVFMFHGLHVASSDATHVAKRYYDEGYTVLAFDQEGHGKSDGIRGEVRSLEGAAKDCERFVIKSKSYYPEKLPVFLFGHSMGGAMCVLVSLQIPDLIRGIILVAPALGVNPNFEPFAAKVLRCLNFCGCGSCTIKPADLSLVSTNPYFVAFANDNPEFFQGKINARTAAAMLNGLENIQHVLSKVTASVLAIQGGKDYIVNAESTKEFIRTCSSSDKELLFFENMYHGVLQEKEIQIIIDKSVSWTSQRL